MKSLQTSQRDASVLLSPLSSSSSSHNRFLSSAASVALQMASIFTATLFRSSELNRRGRVIIGTRMRTLIAKGCCGEECRRNKKTAGEPGEQDELSCLRTGHTQICSASSLIVCHFISPHCISLAGFQPATSKNPKNERHSSSVSCLRGRQPPCCGNKSKRIYTRVVSTSARLQPERHHGAALSQPSI